MFDMMALSNADAERLVSRSLMRMNHEGAQTSTSPLMSLKLDAVEPWLLLLLVSPVDGLVTPIIGLKGMWDWPRAWPGDTIGGLEDFFA